MAWDPYHLYCRLPLILRGVNIKEVFWQKKNKAALDTANIPILLRKDAMLFAKGRSIDIAYASAWKFEQLEGSLAWDVYEGKIFRQ